MHRTITISLGLLAACSDSPPANVAGDYSMNFTNRENGCQFDNWTEGDTSTGIMVTVTQSGGDAQAIVQGGVGAYVDLVIGGRTFVGGVSESRLDATLIGTRAYTQSGCTYTFTAELNGTLSRDTLAGTIEYRPQTNGSPDCGVLANCVSRAEFNGLRPPN
ncbi:MAG: hypothetical protein H0T79_20340 [Deltaproteobacteria bacterium]|nr:hypothetical protein [Deltaproteobacteria bacterium]